MATILSILVYFGFIIAVGTFFAKRNNNLNEYIIGNRSNNKWVTAISAQASDMSSWLLMGLPGAIYLSGLSAASGVWTAIGLVIGTFLNWHFVAEKLRRYSALAGDAITLPQYFENRFGDKTNLLRVISGIIIIVFCTLYTASGLNAGGKLFAIIFPSLSYQAALLCTLLIVVLYTVIGGFKAVCWTDLFQGMLMLIALMIIPMVVLGKVDPAESARNMMQAGEGYFSLLMSTSGESLPFRSIINDLAWGLGYFGIPYVLIRFMATKNPASIGASKRIAMVWVSISLFASCFLGVVGRIYFGDAFIANPSEAETIFIKLALDTCAPFIAGILLSAILAALMSTADSQLLSASSSFTNDIVKIITRSSLSSRTEVAISRGCIVTISIIAGYLALDENQTVMSMVQYAWAGFGAAFGPLVLLSLFSRRMNYKGAIASMVTGFLVTVLWNNFLASVTGVYELVPGFILALIAGLVVSHLTEMPHKDVLSQYDALASKKQRTL
ncbi:MAG: sodium/proline symporter PutP [Rikenellaceae bacterium]